MRLEIREMKRNDEYFVSTCTHINETAEKDRSGKRRATWFKRMRKKGFRVFVARINGEPAGFIYLMPIEVCPWGPLGEQLIAIPCLCVLKKAQGKGAGEALINAAEAYARKIGKKGIVTTAYHHDFWFMPSSFFEHLGFTDADTRDAGLHNENHFPTKVSVIWKPFVKADKPHFATRRYRYRPVKNKVVIDLFFNTFCATSDIEAERVRKVVREFGKNVVLREHRADDRCVLERYGLARGIFINGKEIGWGYEAPPDGLRKAISDAIKGTRTP